MAVNLTYVLVIAIYFEAIDRFATNFHKIYTMLVHRTVTNHFELKSKWRLT